MAKTKDIFSKMVDNQNQLMETLTKKANEAMELMAYDENLAEEGQKLLTEYWEKQRQVTEEAMKADQPEKMWTKFPEQFAKAVELQNGFYNKTMEYYKSVWEKFTPGNNEDKTKKFADLYQESMKAMVDTMNANTQVFQEMTTEATKAKK